MIEYHDREWGVPIHDDRHLFELLILEGAQAGLSWSTVLRKRSAYRDAFARFDPHVVASMTPAMVEELLTSSLIIRNRRKIEAAIANARAFLRLVEQSGSFDRYLWSFVQGRPIQNTWRSEGEVPAQTDISRVMSHDLKRRGFAFVGPTICYAYMQSAGLVNDHVVDCFRHCELASQPMQPAS